MNPLPLLHLFLLTSVVILCSDQSVGLQSSLILLGLPTKTLYEFFFLQYATCPAYLINLVLITLIIFGMECKS